VSTTPRERQTYFIRAVTAGNVVLTLNMSVQICGYEELRISSNEPISYDWNIADNEDPVQLNVSTMFLNSDPTCQISNYTLKTTDLEELPDNFKSNFELIDYDLVQISSVEVGEFEFLVEAATLAGILSYKTITVNIAPDEEGLSFLTQSTIPEWEELPAESITVNVIVDGDGAVTGGAAFEYVSPTATD